VGDGFQKVDLVGPRVLPEAEEDHPGRAVCHVSIMAYWASARASVSTPRSCCAGSTPVQNGSASVRRHASSATGHIPSAKPYRSRMYGCRWTQGTYSAVETPSA